MNRDSTENSPLLSVDHLTVRFPIGRSGWRKTNHLYAVDDVSFSVDSGETLAIVGESGSGKTTAALAVAGLLDCHDSNILLDGQNVLTLKGEELRSIRQKVQIVFQDPYSSLNPRQRAEDIVREPLDSLSSKGKAEKQEIVDQMFSAVGLHPEQKRLFPHQFSGGQRQRIGIARALATRPKLVICDEPVSALDVAVQAQILNLLRSLQKEFGLTYLFISHDLGVVQFMCDRIAVMYMGKIVEQSSRTELFGNPKHPYTRALLSAVPNISSLKHGISQRIMIEGDPPDPANRPTGCRFASRCPVATEDCWKTEPLLRSFPNEHRVACHLVDSNGVPPDLKKSIG